MWFDSEEEIARKEELEKMEEKVMFEHTVKTELESPGSTHVPFFSNPEKARVLEKAIKTASGIRWRNRASTAESSGYDETDRELSEEEIKRNDADQIEEVWIPIGAIIGIVGVICFMIWELRFIVSGIMKFFMPELIELSCWAEQFTMPTIIVASIVTIITATIIIRAARGKRKEYEESLRKEKEREIKKVEEGIKTRKAAEEIRMTALREVSNSKASREIKEGFEIGSALKKYFNEGREGEQIILRSHNEMSRILEKYPEIRKGIDRLMFVTPYAINKKVQDYACKSGGEREREFARGVAYGIRHGTIHSYY